MAVTRIEMEGSQSDLLCGIIRDASERKQAELTLKQSEHRFRAIFEQEHQLVVLIDRNGLVREANHAALWIVGDEREGLVGKLLWEAPWWARDLRQRDQIRGWIEAAADGALIQDELELMTLDGDLRTVDFSMKAVQVTSNGPTVFLAEMRDVTETRRAQAREVSMLRALASIGESASILVHEIKNPITSVNLALKAVATLLGEDERAALDDLLLRLRKLERTMQRTLSFARPLELRRRPVPVQELLKGAREQLLPEAEDKQVSMEVNVPKECPPILVDAGQMEEMLVNLLRNSLDVLEEGGQVLLTCEIHEGQVDLLVDDNGPGVPDSVRSTIFDPFVTTKEEGTGVGLALCKKVVEAHEGELTLEKSPLGGARFRICMAAGLRQDA
jgi:two-component system sensor kinase FixL